MLQKIRALFARSPELAVLAGAVAAGVGGLGIYGVVSLVGSSDGDSSPQPPPAGTAQTAAAPTPTPAPATTDLSASVVSSKILEYSVVNCVPSQITFGAPSDFPTLDLWEKNWLATGKYTLASTGPAHQNGMTMGSDTSEDVLTYVESVSDTLSVRMTVTIDKFAQLYFRQRQYTACLVVPMAVNILDTTLDPGGKQATVIFTYGPPATTDFTVDMLHGAYPATNPPYVQAKQLPMWTMQHTAYFQKLDATGWGVNTIR